MKAFGLIGKSLKHSFSPSYFKNKFAELQLEDHVYEPYELEELSELPAFIRKNSNLVGLNVTIPYKEEVLKYINVLDPVSQKISAVNTILIKRENDEIITYGYNTDVIGFRSLITPFLSKIHSPKALILGSGGASKAVKFALKATGIAFNVVSRKPQVGDLAYSAVTTDILRNHTFIINTTPLGMYPHVDELPDIPYHGLTEENILIDLIYNPERTAFMAMGEKKGCLVTNGLAMLSSQAEASWEIWKDN